MVDVSEQISELSAELLLKAIGELSNVAYNAGRLVHDAGQDAGYIARSALLGFINATKEYNSKKDAEKYGPIDFSDYNRKTQKLIKKFITAAQEEGAPYKQVTVHSQDVKLVEKWLKEQDVFYVAASSNNQDVKPGAEKTMIFFLEKNEKEVNNALSLVAYEKGLINEIPPTAFLFLHDKDDVAVVDGLDVYELEVFRQCAKQLGLGYSAMINGVDEKTGEVYGDSADTYKIMSSRKDADKLAAVMQQVSWSMTGEYKNGIKEKIKERYSIRKEIQDLIENGVKEGKQFLINKNGEKIAVENAKYIVNVNTPSQYIKMTAEGFTHYKYGEKLGFISKDDPEYLDKLNDVLGDFTDAVVIDAGEWEAGNLGKSELRKSKIKEKISVFPPQHDMEKENKDLRKANKKYKEEKQSLEESAWLFHRFDTEKAFSEVIEANYNNPSELLEETVSVHFHYNDAVKHSEKYRYFDVVKDEKAIDNIILSARERSMGNDNYEPDIEQEVSMS